MNQVKKSTFADRIRRAWRAFRSQPAGSLIVGMELKKCTECDYRYTAEEKAPPAEYFHEIKYLDNLVLVVFYKAAESGREEIAWAHGYIIHQGARVHYPPGRGRHRAGHQLRHETHLGTGARAVNTQRDREERNA